MKTVLQPLNEKAAEIVVRHADLLQSSQMEPLLLQLVAHVMAYRVILKRCACCAAGAGFPSSGQERAGEQQDLQNLLLKICLGCQVGGGGPA